MHGSAYRKFAPLVLRWGIGLIFLWTGVRAAFVPSGLYPLFPEWILDNHLAVADAFARIRGVAVFLLAALLLVGLFTRLAALLLALDLTLTITVLSSFQLFSLEQLPALLALATVFLIGPDVWGVDAYHGERLRGTPVGRLAYVFDR